MTHRATVVCQVWWS